jgi:hypothetical protein
MCFALDLSIGIAQVHPPRNFDAVAAVNFLKKIARSFLLADVTDNTHW